MKKRQKNFSSKFRSYSTRTRKLKKKIAKKIKKVKKLIPALFLAKTGCDRLRNREKLLLPNSVHSRPGQENSEKKKQTN